MNRKTDATEITCKILKIAWVTESALKHCRLSMALKSVFTFSVLFLFSYCEAKPENCSESRCKLLPVGGRFASEFRRKASQKGVRMVYLDLRIGNESYDPLDFKDEFLADRWVWASEISEPMLSLSFDYDILSLGLLTYQVRRMDLHLEDQPNGCLATLNSSCRNIVIGRMLLNETEYSSASDGVSHDTDVVCVAVIEKMNFYSGFFYGNVFYHCCRKSEQASVWQASSIECEIAAEISDWFKAFSGTLNILTMVMILYCPALLLALPDVIFNLKEECEKEIERIQRAREQRQQAQDSDFTESYALVQRGNRSVQDQTQYGSLSLDGNSGSTVEGNERTYRPISRVNESVNQSVVYLDDASPVTCSTLFGKYTQNFTDLIPFNIKLAFIFYCIIPIFVHIKLGLNYLVKREFVVELTSKQQALLSGRVFAFLFDMKSFTSIATAAFPLMLILFSSPTDFLLTGENPSSSAQCFVCSENTSSIGEDMPKHLEKLQRKIFEWSRRFINLHKVGIEKSIEYCTHNCVGQVFKTDECDCCQLETLQPVCGRLKRALKVFMFLICNVIIVTFVGLYLGVIYLCISLPAMLGLLGIKYSPCGSLVVVAFRKFYQIAVSEVIELRKRRRPSNWKKWCSLVVYYILLFLVLLSSFFLVGFLLLAVCLIGGLSCRFIIRMFGFIIMGLVLNAEIASPFVTFVVVAATNMHLCYFNMQERYKEVKQIISKQWQKRKNLLFDKSMSNSEEGTIPGDLFWHVCGDKSKSKHIVLPVRSEIFRMLGIMALILLFLFLSLCSVIFLRNTYNVTAVASAIAVFVSGQIPGLFFTGLTKEKKFTGRTRKGMIKEIDAAVLEYIKKRNDIYDIPLD